MVRDFGVSRREYVTLAKATLFFVFSPSFSVGTVSERYDKP